MTLTAKELMGRFSALFSWEEIEEKDYANYGIANLEEAKVIVSYKIGTLYRSFNTMTLYDYGKDDGFIKELESSYESLQSDIDEQEEFGVFPLHWESFGKGKFLSVLKLIHNPIMSIIDLFFTLDGNVYCFHTYLPNEEKNYNLDYLVENYRAINHVVYEINEVSKK